MNEFKTINFVESNVEALQQYELISLDFFDTIVWRIRPETDLLKECVEDLLAPKINYNEFIEAKDESEAIVRFKTFQQGFDKEASLISIYECAFEALGLSAQSANEFCDALVEKEANNLVFHQGVTEWIENLKSVRKICITSDTYYSVKHFQLFLKNIGLDKFDLPIYLSGEEKLNKASGNLFKKVLENEKIECHQLIHIGDNRYSDIEMAKSLGIESRMFIPTQPLEHLRSLARFGSDYLGPVLIDFLLELQETQNNHSFFLGRDGHALYQLACRLGLNNISYLYINRPIANQLSTFELDNSVISYINVEHKSEGIWGLVTVYGLYDSPFSKALEKFIIDNELYQSQIFTSEITKAIVDDEQLKTLFDSCISQRRINVVKYLRQYFGQKERVHLVDIGWRGQIREKLKDSIDNEFSLSLFCSTNVESHKNAYIASNTNNSFALETLAKFRPMLEFCVGETVGSVKYISDDGIPVFSDASPSYNAHIIQMAMYGRALKKHCNKSTSKAIRLNQLVNFLNQLPQVLFDALSEDYPDLHIGQQTVISFSDILTSDCNRNVTSIESTQEPQQFIYRFLKSMNRLKSNENIVLYGAGSGMEFVIAYLKQQCSAIVDINPELKNTTFNGIKIYGISYLEGFQGKVLVTVIGRKSLLQNKLSQYDLDIEFLEDLM